MDLYTLTRKFTPNKLITEFTSAIWTQRYSSAGDMQLVVPATAANRRMLQPGTFIGLRGTKEIMMLETQSVEKQLMTVTGSSLVKFLDERYSWFRNTEYNEESNSKYTAPLELHTSPAQMISTAVQAMVINPAPYTGGFDTANLDWTRDKIPGLELGRVSDTGTQKDLSLPLGSLYDGIQKLASDEGVGFRLYLSSFNYTAGTWVLKFDTYLGRDRTSGQETNELVRLTPRLDSLTDTKEIGSLANYKNVIYVNYKNRISIHYTEPTMPIPEGFDRRVLLVEAEDIYLATQERIDAYRATVARNEAAKHIYVLSVDGQVSPQIGYQFGTDYGLGDIIELEGLTGILSKARVTEYIRSQDEFGEKEYPTLAVIDPLSTGFMPDVEPEPDDDDGDDSDGDPDDGDDGDGVDGPETDDDDEDDDPNDDPDWPDDDEDDGDEGPDGEETGDPYNVSPLPQWLPAAVVTYRPEVRADSDWYPENNVSHSAWAAYPVNGSGTAIGSV